MSLHKRIAASPTVNRVVAALFGGWLRLVWLTSKRERDGWEAVAELVDRHGAVILVCWHQRIMMTPWIFDLSHARCQGLTSTGRAGRLMGWVHRLYGYGSVPMPKGVLGAAEMKAVLSGLREGVSVGMSPDGPRGPARVAKVMPIQWARAAKVPVVVFTFSATRYWTWGTWDKLMFPKPFGRLLLVWRLWDREIPARFTAEEGEALAAELSAYMDAVTAEADARLA
jgi:lysophospholipid acyltransferase (LPLAT)-like uncharacterized protein